MIRALIGAKSRGLAPKSCLQACASCTQWVRGFTEQEAIKYQTIKVSAEDAAGSITICRPKALNAVNTLVRAKSISLTRGQLSELTRKKGIVFIKRSVIHAKGTTHESATSACGLCMQAMEEIVHAAQALDKRPDVKTLIITGEGAKYFAAGADIKEMADQTYDEVEVLPRTCLAHHSRLSAHPRHVATLAAALQKDQWLMAASESEQHPTSQAYRKRFMEGWKGLAAVRKPIIAAVNGYALGGGCEVAMMADIIIASENAVFGQVICSFKIIVQTGCRVDMVAAGNSGAPGLVLHPRS